MVLIHPMEWKFALTHLEFETQYDFGEALMVYESGRHLSHLQSLSCWVRRMQHIEVLGRLLSACASGLRSFDLSTYGRRGQCGCYHASCVILRLLTNDPQ